ncbi:protein SPT2 homolog isoform X2 [Thalassophryne amazonica]|uniref:protein SPT2 homolog isoform X2 n=1 Tax=Thalassophryne amazonica TaxID=390379 RepID=UPI00147133A7|nr:protein SPT2 homolog isoform X2 [Thalassophryne amazonica]
MMDFDNILNIASENQGGNVVQKRYSLEAGPPKKDPKSKGVNPAAVQALLKKRSLDAKMKEMEQKKQKQELLAKRVELKSDRKARAMASRTKDNFHGYNGIPVIQSPKKRRSKSEMQEEKMRNAGQYQDIDMLGKDTYDPEDEDDNFEYDQTDSEPEPEPLRAGKIIDVGESSSKPFPKKQNEAPRRPPPPMKFADLLKLAEEKQFIPVELKPKIVKTDERPRTAEEIRELEMERKAKRWDKDRDPRAERERDSRYHSVSKTMKKGTSEKEQKHLKQQQSSAEKSSPLTFSEKKSHLTPKSDKGQSSTRASKPKTPHGDRDRSKIHMSNSSGATNDKISSKAAFLPGSSKQEGSKPSFSHRSTPSSDLGLKKQSVPQGRSAALPGMRLPGTSVSAQKSHQGFQSKSVQGSLLKQGPSDGGNRPRKDEPLRPGINSNIKSSCSASRPSLDTSVKPGCNPQARPTGMVQSKPNGSSQARTVGTTQQRHSGNVGAQLTGNESRQTGRDWVRTDDGVRLPGRPGSDGVQFPRRPGGGGGASPRHPGGGGGPAAGRPGGGRGQAPVQPGGGGRPAAGRMSGGGGGAAAGQMSGSIGSGPGRSKCTVVSETISSKNVYGARQGPIPREGMQQRPGVPPRPGMQNRPMNRPPGPVLPPITSAYKRKYEDEEDEYDSELDDFIDDEGEPQHEISKHIKEIFGYDRTRYVLAVVQDVPCSGPSSCLVDITLCVSPISD